MYLDESIDRRSEEAAVRFADDVEAVRSGVGFVQDRAAYMRWRSRQASRQGSGKNLAQLARDFGGQVRHGDLEFRN